MGLYQSYLQAFVTNSPAILAEGKTVDSLAVGQIGFVDAKTHKAVTAPTYAKNKAIKAVWGTPNIDNGNFFGAPNENEYTQLIKGKLITGVRAKAAQRGQTPVYSLGWSGDVSDTDTLSIKPGEIKNLWIKLTGTIIDRLYTTQGLVKQIVLENDCIDNCDPSCDTVSSPQLAYQIVDKVSKDKDLRKFIRLTSVVECTPALDAPVETTCYKFAITVCDTGDSAALGVLSAQYPDEDITLKSRNGALSTYGVVKDANVAPAAYSQTGVFVPECATCPAAYTLIPEAKVFQVRTPDETVVADVQAAFTGETSVTLINTDPQFNTFAVTFATTVDSETVVTAGETAGFVVTEIGVQKDICQQTTPTTVAWAADGTLQKQERDFRITLLDSVCGTDRLADLQAAYPDLTIAVVDAAGDCVHTYETTVTSKCYEVGCGVENIEFTPPAIFEGAEWKEVKPAGPAEDAECKVGVLFETAFFHKATNECTFDAFPYENDIVHIQVSNYNPDFNADPCETNWVFKQLRGVKYPQGHGQYVRDIEKKSKMYDLRFRSTDNVVRELEGYSLQADPSKYYDEYVLSFDHKWKTAGGWAEQYTDSYNVHFFVPEGQGAQIEAVLNSYVTSAGIEEDGAAL